MDTVAALLAARAGDERPGLLFEDESYSWAQIVEEGAARAELALARRVEGPFHVGVLLDNVPEYLFWIAGAALAGAAVVGVNSTRRGAELVRDVRHTDCQLLVTDGAHMPLLDGLDLGIAPDDVLLVDGTDYADAVRSHARAGLPDVRVEPGGAPGAHPMATAPSLAP